MAIAQPLALYKTQIYGRGNVNALPAAGDANFGKNSMFVDSVGNIYVTGTSFNGLDTDFLTVKYSGAGAIQWRVVTSGASGSNDIAYAITLDAAGNVFVTGSTQSMGQTDYLTVKYDASGVEQWRVTMNGAADGNDEAYGIVSDSSGNVVVTGVSVNGNGNNDYVTVKYNAAGAEQWRMLMDGAGNSYDRSVAICLDGSGNPIVTGYSYNAFKFDYLTVKYLASGPELWRRAMDGNTQGIDVAFAMACDANDNIFVTGKSYNGSYFDYLTVKYNTNGIEQWRTNSPSMPSLNVTRTAYAIAVDATGNVLVHGSEQDNGAQIGPSNPLHLTIKYNASGVKQWGATLNGSGSGVDIFSTLTTDGAGNIYTTGFADNGGNNELVVVKYAPDGSELWRAYAGAGITSSAVLMAIRTDSAGNVIVAGFRSTGLENDFLVVKFDATGQRLWGANEGESTGLTTEFASGGPGKYALALDNVGNAYVTGRSGVSSYGDFITTKIDSNGVEQWRAMLNGASGNVDRAIAIAVDAVGNVFVAGDSFSAGYGNFMTAKYSASGIEQWRAQPSMAPSGSNSVRALAVDFAGNVIVTGAAAGKDFLTIKYDTAGNELWKIQADGIGAGNDVPVAITVDAAGNSYVVGSSFDGNYDGYMTIKYFPSGVEHWRAVLPGGANAPRQPFAIATDTAGNVYVAGDSTVKYSPIGAELWHTTETYRAYAMALASDGSVIVGGAGGLVVKYSSSGAEIWRRTVNGIVDPNDVVLAVAVDSEGSAYVTSRNSGDANADYLTIKFAADGFERWRTTTTTGGGGGVGGIAMSLDSSRNLILAGNAIDGVMPSAIMVAKISQAPPPPSGVTASPGNGMLSISFVPPPSADSPILSYTATCSPGAIPTIGSVSPIIVAGLTNDLTYTCSISATNAFGTGQASTPVQATPTASASLVLFAVYSRKFHSSAGIFNLAVSHGIPISGPITVEPRYISAGHALVFKFNNIVTAPTSVSVTDANLIPVGSISSVLASGDEIIVTLVGIPDKKRVIVSLSGVNGGTNAEAAVAFMIGDVSSSRSVGANDLSAIKARQGQPANFSNFRFDLDLSGHINSTDLAAAKARSGSIVP